MEWISVKDRLPEMFVNVLGYSSNGKIRIICVDASGELDEYELGDIPDHWTYWTLLPEPPKK